MSICKHCKEEFDKVRSSHIFCSNICATKDWDISHPNKRKANASRQNKKRSIEKPHYNRWSSMMERCYSVKHIHYKHYGGRGITVHKDWHKFENYEKDVTPLFVIARNKYPDKKLTGDRADNNGIYELSNFRVVDWKTQANNRRNNKRKGMAGGTAI